MDFNIEYKHYRDFHSVIDKVAKRFSQLQVKLRQEEQGTPGYEVRFNHSTQFNDHFEQRFVSHES